MKTTIHIVGNILAISILIMAATCSKWEVVEPTGYQKPANDSIMVHRDHSSLSPVVTSHNDEPPVAPSSQDSCPTLTTFTTPYSMMARFQKALAGEVQLPADSIFIELRSYGNAFTNYFLWYDGTSFDDAGLKTAIEDTYVSSYALVINYTDPTIEYFELYVAVYDPNIQVGANTFDRPMLVIEPYVNGRVAIRLMFAFEQLKVWPTVNMDILEVEEAVEFFPHNTVIFDQIGLDSMELYNVLDFYVDNCITGDFASFRFTTGDTMYINAIMHDYLEWNVRF